MFIDFRERGRKREGEKKRNIHVREKHPPVVRAAISDQTHNAGMSPDQESNPQPFGV